MVEPLCKMGAIHFVVVVRRFRFAHENLSAVLEKAILATSVQNNLAFALTRRRLFRNGVACLRRIAVLFLINTVVGIHPCFVEKDNK